MRIAVLRGGPSLHYDASLRTGEQVLAVLRSEPEKYTPVDVFISRGGEWHVGGRRKEPVNALKHVDLVWNALHGIYGEDGQVSRLLSNLYVPYTGSDTIGLALSNSTDMTRERFAERELLTPMHKVLHGSVTLDELADIFRTYLHPIAVKPAQGRSGDGTKLVYGFEELKSAVADAFRHSDRVMIDELIRGTEARCGVIESFRGKGLYALMPEPGGFSPETHKQIESMARAAHEMLGLRHYSSSSFLVTPKGKIYITETNALPELSPESHFPKALTKLKILPKEFVEHVITLAAV